MNSRAEMVKVVDLQQKTNFTDKKYNKTMEAGLPRKKNRQKGPTTSS